MLPTGLGPNLAHVANVQDSARLLDYLEKDKIPLVLIARCEGKMKRGGIMKWKHSLSIIVLAVLAIGTTTFTGTGASAGAVPSQTLVTTGVYVGSCNNEITSGVIDNGAVVLYGLGNLTDPSCQNSPLPLQPMPISAKGSLANLAVASEEIAESTPTTVTLYINGTASPLSCTVSQTSTGCVDRVHKVPVNASDTFSVWATCSTDGSSNCAQGLQVTLDRLQSANQ